MHGKKQFHIPVALSRCMLFNPHQGLHNMSFPPVLNSISNVNIKSHHGRTQQVGYFMCHKILYGVTSVSPEQ
ncbi:predicted protein [Sclerotinia sclerotiorum 1980 UF-70]|uniref:Uncharacterized protein n=1 Tax=Sclerotinia sclerotiorum (strain ATCC 18683 / 1980 / Ss-1) TaxID=665079 RepID=A7EW25_SCLS1|nr:predicted protein [Sclerotinia sclerotiorum 1980 UF-70]EDN93667.1 predicted protein [Sclerotinia sclerotiorum 1980 UF-70]